jgi:pentatricopeptide repeat protein
VTKGYCTIGDTDKEVLILANLLKGTPRATLVAYNTITKGYCDSGNISDTLRILELMEPNGCEANGRSYTELIRGFCEIAKWNRLLDYSVKWWVMGYAQMKLPVIHS